jgi:hypothetical protein
MRYSTALGLLAAGVLAAGGVAALTRGWVVPWLRRSVVRPALWGAGALVFAAGMATGLSTQFYDVSLGLGDALMALTVAQISIGGLLQHRAQRPGRAKESAA